MRSWFCNSSGADAVAEVEVGGNGGDDIVHRDALVIELLHKGLYDLLFVGRDAEHALFLFKVDLRALRVVVALQDLVEELARRNEFEAVFLALFAVLLLFLLFVRLGRRFVRIVDGVDLVEVLLGDLLHAHLPARLGDLFGEHEVGIIYRFQQSERLGIFIGERGKIDRVVGHDLVADLAAVIGIGDDDEHLADAGVLDGARLIFGDDGILCGEQFARLGMEDVVRDAAAGQTVREIELFVELIAPHLHHVVTARVEEEVVEVLAHRFLGGNFAGAQTAVKRDEAVRLRFDGRRILLVALDGGGDHLVAAEELLEGAVGAVAQRAQKHSGSQLALSVHAHPQDALRILFEFQPCPAVGDDGRLVDLLARLIRLRDVVYAGRTDKLGDDDALCTVDDEGTVVRHEREIAHKDDGIDDLVLHLVHETHLHAEGQRVRCVAVAALLLVILGRVSELVA